MPQRLPQFWKSSFRIRKLTKNNPRALRNAFGGFLTVVTVVTAVRGDGAPVGFTANSFSSVSLEPPLLLLCPGKFLSSYETFANCTHFAVNILSEGQEAISNTFASSKGNRFAQVPHHLDAHGVPLIDGAIVQFSFTTEQIISAGDHCILIGRIEGFTHVDGSGLGYVNGKYFSLGLERAAFDETSGTAICGAIVEDGDTVLMVQTVDGLQPSHCTHSERGRLINDLRETLVSKGIVAEPGQAYSVFESVKPRAHHTYFLATGHIETPLPGSLLCQSRTLPIRALPAPLSPG
ncbi:flavin reductase family protein [Sulfitobacter sp.]|uniref:flavin reductase family protein n=1 Tax=Sulfitobacter sp. TaxID=1903071 RepID=UPI003003666B